MSTEAWNDLFVRTDVSETNPDQRRGSFGSPDVIPVGTKLANPADYATDASYGRYYQQPFYENQPNYVYVRAKNSSAKESASGTVKLVMCDPAIVLWPGGSDWTPIKTATGSDHCDLVDVQPGKIGVTGDGGPETAPFLVIPDSAGHRCLVTWISTPKHPYPQNPPKITSVDELVKWLVKYPNFAHHNIDVVADTTGAQTQLKPYTSGNTPAKWVFTLNVKMCKGYTVSFSCGRPLHDGSFIQLEPQTVETDAGFGYTITRQVEAGFAADIAFTYNQNNIPLRPGFEVSFVAAKSVARDDPLFAHGYPYHVWDPDNGPTLSDDSRIDVGSVGVMKGG